jgi:hypothetical protein
MRYPWFFAVLVLCVAIPALSGAATLDPNSFHTNANFSVDNNAMSLSSAVATIEPRLGAPGYSWIRISFYSFPVVTDDIAGIMKGDTGSMDKKWNKKASNPKDYNNSYAVIQLSVDKNSKVWQVDMSVPGHSCSIAPFEQDVKTFLQDYQFDGKNLKLKSKGSYVCDMKFMGIPNPKFGWEIDLNTVVYEKVNYSFHKPAL